MKLVHKFTLSVVLPLAVLAAAPAARAQSQPVGLCTGGKDGVYFGAGQFIRDAAGKSAPVDVVPTAGSWENLKAVAEGTRCQAAIVQGDALVAFARTNGGEARSVRRAATLHREYAHVICNRKAGVTDAYDLMNDNKRGLAIGPEGGGSWITERNWAALNKAFEKVPLLPDSGLVAAGSVAAGGGDNAACMLFVAGLRAPLLQKIDQGFGDQLVLVPATGRLFRNAVNERGEKLYEMEDVPAKTYPHLMPQGWFSAKPVEVPSMRAVLVVNPAALGDARYPALIEAVARSRARILAAAGDDGS